MRSLAPERPARNKLFLSLSLGLTYLALGSILLGVQQEQWVLAVIFVLLFNYSEVTRNTILGYSVFIVFWIVFDFMKAFPNYWVQPVHIKDIYLLDKRIFGFVFDGVRYSNYEFFSIHHFLWADLLAGIFYLCWIPVPLAFATILFFTNRLRFLHFSLTFLLVNVLGFVFYYAYPAAPPWYVQQHGFVFAPFTRASEAGLVYFDKFFGIMVFHAIYLKGSNVFAAMPSLHSAYPVIVFFYSLKFKLGKWSLVPGTLCIGIWLAAIYTGHHYVLDVIAGVFTAMIGIAIYSWSYSNVARVKKFVKEYSILISKNTPGSISGSVASNA